MQGLHAELKCRQSCLSSLTECELNAEESTVAWTSGRATFLIPELPRHSAAEISSAVLWGKVRHQLSVPDKASLPFEPSSPSGCRTLLRKLRNFLSYRNYNSGIIDWAFSTAQSGRMFWMITPVAQILQTCDYLRWHGLEVKPTFKP
jgi:hypothetical protein